MTLDEAIAELRHLHGKTRLTRALSVPQPVVDAILAGALDGSLVASPDVAKLVADAEARVWESAADRCQSRADQHVNGMETTWKGGRLHDRLSERRSEATSLRNIMLDEAAAIRRAAEETGT